MLLAGSILLFAGFHPAWAQQVALSLSSGVAQPGSSVALTASLTATGGAKPTAIQWTMSYAAGVTGVAVVARQKSVQCASKSGSTVCALYGIDPNKVLADGAVAAVTITVSATNKSTFLPITLNGIVTSDSRGHSIPSVGTGGIVTVVPPRP